MAQRPSISYDGREELRETLTNLAPNEARNIMRQATYGLARRVEEVLRSRVKKRRGALADSLFSVRRRGTSDEIVSEVRGGAKAPYMLMLEFGTSRTRAQPFIVPGVESVRPELRDWYREEFAQKLAKTLARRARKGG